MGINKPRERQAPQTRALEGFESLAKLASELPGCPRPVQHFIVMLLHETTSRASGAGRFDHGCGTCRTGAGLGLNEVLIQRRQAAAS
jgi:hypothetical protein